MSFQPYPTLILPLQEKTIPSPLPRHHSPGTIPTLRLVREVVLPDDGLLGWSSSRALQQVPDVILQAEAV